MESSVLEELQWKLEKQRGKEKEVSRNDKEWFFSFVH